MNTGSWLAEDPELLRAALEIIETWDQESSTENISVRSPLTDGSDSANDDTISTGTAELDDSGEDTQQEPEPRGSLLVTMRVPPLTVKSVMTKNDSALTKARGLKPSTVASTRHRRREEIIYLRDKVKELGANLAALQKEKKDAQDSSCVNEDGNDKALTVIWRDIAGRQQRFRQKSEFDQAKLRTLLETQMKVAQGLMKLMQKARRMEEDEAFPHVKRMKFLNAPPVRLSEGEQFARIYRHYETLDAAFTFPKFHDGSLKFVDIEVTDQLEEEVLIEYREAWTLPFEIDRVLDAVWEYTFKKNLQKFKQPHSDEQSASCLRTGNTEFVSRHSLRSTISGLDGNFDGQVIGKRFSGDGDRAPAAIITSMCTAPNPVNPGDVDGFRMFDDAWVRVLPVPRNSRELDDQPFTIVQCFQRFRMKFEENAAVRQAAGTLTNMILDKLKVDIELKHDTVETLLLGSRTQ